MNNLHICNVLSNLLYNQFSWSYDLVSNIVSFRLWKKWVVSALPFVNGENILEIGIGPGHLQIALNQENNNMVYGLDLSCSMCQMARRRIAKLSYIPKIVNGISTYLPYPNACFDTIVATFPTATILNRYSLLEFSRTLKTFGKIVILPFAWFKGNLIIERFNHLILHNDNNHNIWFLNIKNIFCEYNLDFSSQIVDFDKSQIMIIIGTKN